MLCVLKRELPRHQETKAIAFLTELARIAPGALPGRLAAPVVEDSA
jgi:hypothetical protein